MCVEHEVWSVPPGKKRPVYQATYELDRWQWAEKHAQALAEHGHDDVEVRIEVTDDEDDDE